MSGSSLTLTGVPGTDVMVNGEWLGEGLGGGDLVLHPRGRAPRDQLHVVAVGLGAGEGDHLAPGSFPGVDGH